MESKRLFVAVEIDDTQRREVADLTQALQKGVRFTKAHPNWVRPEAMHLTLKFLGDTPADRISRIDSALRRALADQTAFDMNLAGLGVFPDPRRPRVLWLGVDHGRRRLKNLAQAVERGLAPMGFEPEQREFHPHLTLARIKTIRGAAEMMDVVESHRARQTSMARVGEVVLFQSELLPQGARYTALQRWPLASPPVHGEDA